MMLRGSIDNGKLVLDDGTFLPDGSRVEVQLRVAGSNRSKKASLDPLAQLSRHAVSTGVSNLADEHDHHAHGTAKRSGKAAKAAKRPRKTA